MVDLIFNPDYSAHLMLYSTSPFGKILTYKLGARMLWKLPIFSFLKKVSGIQILEESISVKYLMLSAMVEVNPVVTISTEWIDTLTFAVAATTQLSFELQSLVIPLLSQCYLELVLLQMTKLDSHFMILKSTIFTSLISEKPRTKILTKIKVAASKNIFSRYF